MKFQLFNIQFKTGFVKLDLIVIINRPFLLYPSNKIICKKHTYIFIYFPRVTYYFSILNCFIRKIFTFLHMEWWANRQLLVKRTLDQGNLKSHAQKIWPQIMKFQRLHSNHEITNQVINNYIHMVEGNNSEFKNRSISFLQHDLYNQ